jgi:arylsulfatase
MGKLFLFIFSFFIFSYKGNNEPISPNIVYILADDLGYGDLGCYGQKIIETPNIDALAKSGKIFTQHYSGAPVCAPSRYVLLTGKHLGHAYVRGNDEWKERGEVWSAKAMEENPALEGQRPIPDSTFTVAEYLKSKGYHTSIFGKWGLGAPFSEGIPNRQGFDTFFGYNCQRQAHNLFPTHLWQNEEIYKLKNPFFDLNQNLPSHLDSSKQESYKRYILNDYAPEIIHQKALEYLAKQEKDQPFFLYYASPLPHVPLQAPDRWVKHYQQKIGNEKPYTKGGYYPNFSPKATYAAMISYLDQQVGDIVKTLKDKDLYQNTLIIFSSDNGPSFAGGVNPQYFNSAGMFQAQYGRGKGFVYEGGIRVPMIASWPAVIKPESRSEHVSSFYDFFATIKHLLEGTNTFNDGISYLNELKGQKQKKHKYLYWEFPEYNGQQALRLGDWKAVRTDLHTGKITTQLYNLKTDPIEEKNIAAGNPKIIKKIEKIFIENHTIPQIEKFKIAVLENKK